MVAARPHLLKNRRVGDGNYLASVSDLMIGMLFIFIIILMAFALSYRAAQATTDEATRQLKADNDRLTDSDRLRSEMLLEIQRSLREHGIEVDVDLENGVLRLPESLLFDSGSADFRPGGAQAIAELGSALSSILPCYSTGVKPTGPCAGSTRSQLDSIFIEGHTDNIPVQNLAFRDNWDLSSQRAKNTYDALVPASDVLSSLRNTRGQPLFSMAAYGETRPVESNDSDAGRAKNRRIDLRFIMVTPSAIHLSTEPRGLLSTSGSSGD